MSPDHVRELAHGKEYENDKEKKVHNILLERGIIRRHRHEEF